MRRHLLPVLLLAGVTGGCADGAVAVPGAPEAVVDVADVFDGDRFGFLVAVTTDPATVTIDPAVWVNDDAEPNGFRIDDPGVAPLDLPIADDAVIEVYRSTGDPATAATVTVDELARWFAGLNGPEESAPFDVVVDGGEVVEMRFVYRP